MGWCAAGGITRLPATGLLLYAGYRSPALKHMGRLCGEKRRLVFLHLVSHHCNWFCDWLHSLFLLGVIMDAVVLILSDARGIYIPRDFLTDNQNEIVWEHCKAWGLTETNKDFWIEATDPTYEHYWEDWDWILANAKYVADNGDVYYLYQDGDLWGLCYKKMSPEQRRQFGMEDDDDGITQDQNDQRGLRP